MEVRFNIFETINDSFAQQGLAGQLSGQYNPFNKSTMMANSQRKLH
jgi:hypothetical protein